MNVRYGPEGKEYIDFLHLEGENIQEKVQLYQFIKAMEKGKLQKAVGILLTSMCQGRPEPKRAKGLFRKQ